MIRKIRDLKLKFYLARKKFYRSFQNKEDSEMEAQRKRAKEMALPEIKQKVKEYYYKLRFLEDIINQAKINNNSKILDVGCGILTVLHFLPGVLKIGIDPLADEYKKIYKYPLGLIIQKSYGEKLKYAKESFDVVFITNALDHTKDPKQVILEIWRVLKNKGYLVLTNGLVEKKHKRSRAHPHNLVESDILKLLSDKFKIIFKRYSQWPWIRKYYLDQVYSDNKKLKEIIILAQK